MQQIGKELGVRFALQGGVQRSGDKIRINAQLADTTTNAQLWSESFDGSQGDLFALQEMVTDAHWQQHLNLASDYLDIGEPAMAIELLTRGHQIEPKGCR